MRFCEPFFGGAYSSSMRMRKTKIQNGVLHMAVGLLLILLSVGLRVSDGLLSLFNLELHTDRRWEDDPCDELSSKGSGLLQDPCEELPSKGSGLLQRTTYTSSAIDVQCCKDNYSYCRVCHDYFWAQCRLGRWPEVCLRGIPAGPGAGARNCWGQASARDLSFGGEAGHDGAWCCCTLPAGIVAVYPKLQSSHNFQTISSLTSTSTTNPRKSVLYRH